MPNWNLNMLRNAYLILTLTMLFWATNIIAGKYAVGHVSPILLASLRWLVAAAILVPFAALNLRQDWPAIRRNLPFIAAMGGLGIGGFNILLYVAVHFTSGINVSILQATMPMMVFVINFLIFGVRVGWMQIAGFLATLLGIALIAGDGSFERLRDFQLNVGDVALLVALLCYSSFTVGLRKMPKLHLNSSMLVFFLNAFAFSAIATLFEAANDTLLWPDLTGWAVVLFTAIFPSVLAQTFFVRGTQIVGANRAGLFVNLLPVFGTLLSILMLGEQFHAYHAIALVVVLGGIALAERMRPRA